MPRLPVVALALVALAPAPGRAQQVASDSARLLVMRSDRVIGSEDFAYRRQTESAGGGVSFVATATGDSATLRVALTAGPRRITVRVASGAGETAREYPGGAPALVADERVLSLYALVAQLDPGPITVFGPPPGGRRAATLTLVGDEARPGTSALLRHLVVQSGEDLVDVWLDPEGRLMRVAIPSRGLVAERVAQP
jgi:hypothetical protein